VIKTADWLIDMGPEGGSRGGTVIDEGTPEQIAANPRSYTGEFLRPILEGREVPVGAQQPSLVDVPAPLGGKGAAKKAAAKKAAATTTKAAVATRTPTKKAPVKKVVAKKAVAKKTPVKTTVTKRAPAKTTGTRAATGGTTRSSARLAG
jgi:excinuclease ABC subunit A